MKDRETLKPIDSAVVSSVLFYLARKNYYASAIIPVLPDFLHLVNENVALNQAVDTIVSQDDFDSQHPEINSGECRSAVKTINHFFEYLYFTSEAITGRSNA